MGLADIIYMIQDNDRRTDPENPNSDFLPYYPDQIPVFDQNNVTPLIDGNTYALDLFNEIKALEANRNNGTSIGSNQRIYVSNWLFGIDCKVNGVTFRSLLEKAANEGVDVRLLLWVSDTQIKLDNTIEFTGESIPFTDVGRDNIKTGNRLRQNLNLENKVIFNTLSHLYGSCHNKLVLLAEKNASGERGLAYTGGIDFADSRMTDRRHFYNFYHNDRDDSDPDNDINRVINCWHDAQVKLEGPATWPAFEFFKSMWNELVSDRETLESKHISVYKGGIPGQETYETEVAGFENTIKIWLKDNFYYAVPQHAVKFDAADVITPGIPAESKNIVQSLRTVPNTLQLTWQSANRIFPAIGGHTLETIPNGIYEIQLAFKVAISKAREYIYIENSVIYSRDILTYIRNAITAEENLKVIFLTATSSNVAKFTSPLTEHNYYLHRYLFDGLEDDEKERIMVYKSSSYYIHSKIMIIDDKFALIGSANFANRSLYCDFEHSIAFIDNDGYDSVKQLRIDLWAEHFRISENEKTQLADINEALHIWNETWGTAGASFKLPFYATSSYTDLTEELDRYEDIEVRASLFPLRLFTRDTDGNRLPLPGPVGKADSGEDGFLEDSNLPEDSSIDLRGGWVYIISGPGAGAFFYIFSHEGHRIYFDRAAPSPFDNTNIYLLLYPVINPVVIYEPAEDFAFTRSQELEEIGELP